MMDLKILVTGTGRCGTVFVANLLTSMGRPCGHEAVFGPQGLERAERIIRGGDEPNNSEISRSGTILSEGMVLVGDSSYMSAPFLKRFDTTVIHLVRNPMGVVGSLVGEVFRNFSNPFPTHFDDAPDHFLYERFMYEHLPDLGEEMPQLDRACLFYIRWNEMIESSGRVDLFHRVEDNTDRIRKLVGSPGWGYCDDRCNSFSDSSRAWHLSDVESPRIRSEMRDIMKRYGYPPEPRLS
jgi:hypothetical protein